MILSWGRKLWGHTTWHYWKDRGDRIFLHHYWKWLGFYIVCVNDRGLKKINKSRTRLMTKLRKENHFHFHFFGTFSHFPGGLYSFKQTTSLNCKPPMENKFADNLWPSLNILQIYIIYRWRQILLIYYLFAIFFKPTHKGVSVFWLCYHGDSLHSVPGVWERAGSCWCCVGVFAVKKWHIPTVWERSLSSHLQLGASRKQLCLLSSPGAGVAFILLHVKEIWS